MVYGGDAIRNIHALSLALDSHLVNNCYDFYPTSHFSPYLSLSSTGRWAIFVHHYLFISSDYYLLHTQMQQCTVCSLLTYAQHAYLRATFLYSI